MIKSVNQIRLELAEIQASHKQLNSFFWGDFLRAYKENRVNYPLMGAFYPTSTLLRNQTQLQLRIYIADKLYKDWSNLNDIESDTLQICRDVFNIMNNSTRWQTIGRVQSCSVTKFINRGGDEVAGHEMTMNFLIRDRDGVCGLPMEGYDFDQVTGSLCSPVQIYEDGVLIDTVPSGGVYNVVGSPATQVITDSLGNELYSNTIPSGATETQVIQDSTAVLKDTLGTVISTTPILAEGSEDIVAPDSTYLVEYVNGTDIQSGSIVSGGSIVVTVPNPIVCADATVENSNATYTDSVVSGGTLVLPDITVTDSDGSTYTQPSVTDVVCTLAAATTIEVNGTTEGTFNAGSTIDVQLSDSSGVVTPDSVTIVGNDVQIVLPDADAPTGWVRPAGWLELDTVTTGSEKFSGLFAVYETQKNVNTIQITTMGTNTIDWGDGSTQAVTSTVLYTKVYDYATISSAVLVDDAGLNYKMVVVNINMTGISNLQIDRNTTATVIGNARNLGWLDISVDCATMTSFSPAGQGLCNLLQRLLIHNVGATINGAAVFIQLAALRVLKFPFEKLQMSNQTFINNFGDARDENNLPLNINLTINTGSGFNIISNSHLTELGNVTAPFTNSFQNFFFNSVLLKKVGSINASAAGNLVSTFASCVKLTGVINITSSALLTSINGVLNGCFLVDGLTISDCSAVTNTVNAVLNCRNLKSLILTGLTRGITVDDCLMEATEINAFFTSLGTAVGSQTIFIRRNPGSATCNTTIATAKGFTVVIV